MAAACVSLARLLPLPLSASMMPPRSSRLIFCGSRDPFRCTGLSTDGLPPSPPSGQRVGLERSPTRSARSVHGGSPHPSSGSKRARSPSASPALWCGRKGRSFRPLVSHAHEGRNSRLVHATGRPRWRHHGSRAHGGVITCTRTLYQSGGGGFPETRMSATWPACPFPQGAVRPRDSSLAASPSALSPQAPRAASALGGCRPSLQSPPPPPPPSPPPPSPPPPILPEAYPGDHCGWSQHSAREVMKWTVRLEAAGQSITAAVAAARKAAAAKAGFPLKQAAAALAAEWRSPEVLVSEAGALGSKGGFPAERGGQGGGLRP